MRVNWTTLKDFLDSKVLSPQYIDVNEAYWIKLYDGPFELETIINKDDITDPDLIDFETNYKSKSNKNILAQTPGGKIPKVSTYKAEGTSFINVTPDFTDKTTWYQESTKVMNEILTLDTGKIYNSINTYWVDATHAKIYMEDAITEDGTPMHFGGARKYPVKINDNGVEIIEDTDYSVNYVTGVVTLDAGYTAVGAITATYYYAGSSTFTIKPDMGSLIHIEHSELQFTSDLVMTMPVNFDIYVYNPMDLPNKMLYKRTRYKNIKDIINAANLGTGEITPVDVFTKAVCVFPFDYATLKTLKSSDGAELRVSIDDDIPFNGEWGTATFYILTESE